MNIQIMDWKQLTSDLRNALLSRPEQALTKEFKDSVTSIISDVKENGDAAVKELTRKYDSVVISNLVVSQNEIEKAYLDISEDLLKAIRLSLKNITAFHAESKFDSYEMETMPGVRCGKIVKPISRVGLYIPAGSAPLFSTVLMLGAPAKIAGCREVVLCTPPNSKGEIDSAILVAANEVGISKIYKVGGAQAISAMAFGTQSIPKVYKIFGPGNGYVTEAKLQVSTVLNGPSIDMPAGPSEVLVLGDETANPIFVASDLLAQAEHGPDSQVIFVCSSLCTLEKTKMEIEKQLLNLPRKEIAEKSLESARLILAEDETQMVEISNLYAPEHLIIQTKEPGEILKQVENAGSVFLGSYTPESAGDYASGTNHVLPTYGKAASISGVSVASFVKAITYQEISRKGLQTIGPSIEVMARRESLDAHRNSISIRLNE